MAPAGAVVKNPIFGKKKDRIRKLEIQNHKKAGELTMDNEVHASTAVPKALTRGYSNYYLDSMAKAYVPAVDQPPLTVAELNAMDA
jgi:hypothetical protein